MFHTEGQVAPTHMHTQRQIPPPPSPPSTTRTRTHLFHAEGPRGSTGRTNVALICQIFCVCVCVRERGIEIVCHVHAFTCIECIWCCHVPNTHTHTHIDRQTDRQTHTHKHTHIYTEHFSALASPNTQRCRHRRRYTDIDTEIQT